MDHIVQKKNFARPKDRFRKNFVIFLSSMIELMTALPMPVRCGLQQALISLPLHQFGVTR